MRIYVNALRREIDVLGQPSQNAIRLWLWLNLVCWPREKAWKGKDLAKQLKFVGGDAHVRALVNELVKLRFPVFSAIGDPPGYYVACDLDQAKEGLNNRLSRIRDQAEAYRALEQTARALYGEHGISGEVIEQLELVEV